MTAPHATWDPDEDSIDWDAVREIAETPDALVDTLDYLDPFDARNLCLALLHYAALAGDGGAS